MRGTNRYNADKLCKPGNTAGFRVLRFAVLLALLIILIYPLPALAAALPDTNPNFLYIFVNRSLLETNDYLLYACYNLPYTTPPSSAACNTFIFELIDTDGVTVLASTEDTGKPYTYHDRGYNLGVVSFYFAAADNPGWGDLFTLRIKGDPAEFGTPPVYDTVLTASAYSSLTASNVTGNQEEVATNVKTITGPLSVEFGIELMSYQDQVVVLTSAGEIYFLNAIPELNYMAPNLFYFQPLTPDASTRAWGTALGDTYKTRLTGTWFMDAMDDVADWVNVPTILIMGIIMVALCVFVIYQSNKRFGTPIPGYAGSLLVVSGMGILMMGFTVIAIIAFTLVFVGGWFLFFRHSY